MKSKLDHKIDTIVNELNCDIDAVKAHCNKMTNNIKQNRFIFIFIVIVFGIELFWFLIWLLM